MDIQLSVTDIVEPSPGEEGVLGRRGVGRQGEGERRSACDRAVTDVAVDDCEGLAVVEGEGSLATTAVVVGTASDGHVVLLTGLPSSDGRGRSGSEEVQGALAGEVAARSTQRAGDAVVDVLAGEGVLLGSQRRRVGDGHMSRGLAGKQHDRGDEDGLHGAVWCRKNMI